MAKISNNAAGRRRRRMVVRIVYPGGHVELHDAPILAGEIMARHPKCAVAHPDVFRQPLAAVVSPETTLMLGQKFYVVPTSTIRKLQRKFVKRNPNLIAAAATSPAGTVLEGNNTNRCVISGGGGGPRRRKAGCFGCFSNLINGNIVKDKSRDRGYYSNDDYRMGIVNWSDSSGSGSFGSPDGQFLVWNNNNNNNNNNYYNDNKKKKRKKNKGGSGAGPHQSPNRAFGLDNWTPNLESITEE